MCLFLTISNCHVWLLVFGLNDLRDSLQLNVACSLCCHDGIKIRKHRPAKEHSQRTIDLAYLAVSVVLFYSCLFDEAHTTHKAEKKGEMKVRLSSHLSYVLRTSHTCC